MDPTDSYGQILHTRHWLTNPPKKQHLKKTTKTITTNNNNNKKTLLKCQPNIKFNHHVMDTFCFHWPDMHSYVLVRILENTIAILPVRSRIAFLYFHHAPFPAHPSPRELRKALQPQNNLGSKRIHDIFKNWKHTLVLTDDEEELDEEVEVEEEVVTEKEISIPSTPVSMDSYHINTPPSTPNEYAGVTLSDVLLYERNLKEGWIHAPCVVKDGDDNTIILTTKHTSLCLTSRCFSEKMMFINLVKFKHNNAATDDDDDDDKTRVEELSNKAPNDILESLQAKTSHQMDEIEHLASKIDAGRRNISNYTQQLVDLEQSMDILLENINNTIQYNTFRNTLEVLNTQLKDSVRSFHAYRKRVSQLQESVSIHGAFLTSAKQRLEQFKTKVVHHAWYPYTCKSNHFYLITFMPIH